MYDFCRVASVVPKCEVGNTEYNTDEMLKRIKEAELKKADIIVFPELCITGYTCGDLFFQKTLQKEAVNALNKLAANSGRGIIVAGAPLVLNGQIYNTAAVIYAGKVMGIVPKTFLPNYNEFYEKRWFSSSEDLNIEKISSSELGLEGNYEITVGRNIIFNLNDETSFGVEICEDLWTTVAPSSFLALNGAEIILNLSASNETIAKRKYRKDLISQQSAKCISGYVYTSSGEGESTTDLVFSGHTVIAENGTVTAENKKGTDGDYMIVQDIDCAKIKADRLKWKTFKDCAVLYGKYEPCRTVEIDMKLKGDGGEYKFKKLPFVPSSKKDRQERCFGIFEMQTAGLKKRTAVTGCKLVVGVSGGLDSTLALLVAAETMRTLKRPLSEVYGITMPAFGTSERTYNNSLKLMKSMGISIEEIDIKEACRKHFEDIGHDGKTLDLTYENVQARERTQVLMDYAGKIGGLVVGTGDLSELALGWCTYNADHMSMYGVNSGIPKTLVRWMIDSIIEYNVFPESTEVLRDIIDTPISPELLPPDESGKIVQETESIVGPYALHDFFLYNMVRYGFEPERIYYMAKKAFSDDFDSETILKWLKVFYKRFFSQQFKRSCLPDGMKIGSICLSPRGDWRMPSDASANIWLKNIEKIKP